MRDIDEIPLPHDEAAQAFQADARIRSRLRWPSVAQRYPVVETLRRIGTDFLTAQQSEHTLHQHAPIPLTDSSNLLNLP